MEEIEIKIENVSESFSEESSDISREQEKWTPKLEMFIHALAIECKKSCLTHRIYFVRLQLISHILNGVSLSLPILAACINQMPLVTQEYRVVPSVLMLITSGVVSVDRMLGYEKKAQHHNEFAKKYKTLEYSIRYTLSRSKKDRVAADDRVQEFIHEHNVLVTSAP